MTFNEYMLQKYLVKRDALFRNPTLEAATAFLPKPDGGWAKKDTPLASLHKARLQWLDATNDMLRESKEWLQANGYGSSCRGALPLTPEERDRQRIIHGKKPLNGEQ